MSLFGTIVRGVRAPIIKNGDNLAKIVAESVVDACNEGNVKLQDNDIVAVTESIVGKAQGNYATIEQIAKDVHNKFGNETVGVVFPITSRNRFSLLLKGISMGVKKVVICLSFPRDEVGNEIINSNDVFTKNIDMSKTFNEEEFRKTFGFYKHPFTGMDYVEFYKDICGHDKCEIIFSNKVEAILKHTHYVIAADIHSRTRTKEILKKAGAKKVFGLDDILSSSIDGSGFHSEYGLLGSNMSTDKTIKLFPRDCDKFVCMLQQIFKEKTGKHIECMVYGDGAFKDPVGQIWELADPVVSPGFTNGLIGTPNEIKLKFIADNNAKNLSCEDAKTLIMKTIKEKDKDLKSKNASLGTTPRRYTDLLGSLCDLTSGSGDKGTPIVLVQNYFKNFAD